MAAGLLQLLLAALATLGMQVIWQEMKVVLVEAFVGLNQAWAGWTLAGASGHHQQQDHRLEGQLQK